MKPTTLVSLLIALALLATFAACYEPVLFWNSYNEGHMDADEDDESSVLGYNDYNDEDDNASVLYTVFVKTLTGKNINLDLNSSDTISTAKSQIESKKGYAVSKQKLTYMGKTLEDNKTLGDYGITKETTMHLILKS